MNCAHLHPCMLLIMQNMRAAWAMITKFVTWDRAHNSTTYHLFELNILQLSCTRPQEACCFDAAAIQLYEEF